MRAVVDFVNCRNVRVRTDSGETHSPEPGRFAPLLPLDEVEIEIIPPRRGRPGTAQVVEVRWNGDYQLVARVQKMRFGKRHCLGLVPIGLGLDEPISMGEKGRGMKHGDRVVVTVSRRKDNPKALKLIQVDQHLDGECELANAVALSRFGLRKSWSDPVKLEVNALSNTLSKALQETHEDLRHMPFVTIDPDTAKDHDDAVFCEKVKDGYRLMVAIADVSQYVLPSTAIDLDARDRGTSIYLADDVIPMLPERLSNDICSLRPDEDRLALVCDMQIDQAGRISRYEFKEAVIRSHARLGYFEVESDRIDRAFPKDIALNLRNLFEVHNVLIKARGQRGTLEIDLPEAVLETSESGEVRSIQKTRKVVSHSLIEEAMLAANVCAAQMINEHYSGIAMFRVHDEPSRKDVIELNGILSEFGVQMPIDRKLKVSDYGNIRATASMGQTTFNAIQTHILRSLSTAIYCENCKPHFALNYPIYTHFTSPIRRYPDLVVHRLIKNVIRNRRKSTDEKQLQTLASQCSYLERRAEACTRESEKWLKAHFMQFQIGEEYEGVIVDVRSFGIFVQLDAPYVSGMVSIYKLGFEYFEYDEVRRQLIGTDSGSTYALGMLISVRVNNADPELGFIDLELSGGTQMKNRRRKRRRRR